MSSLRRDSAEASIQSYAIFKCCQDSTKVTWLILNLSFEQMLKLLGATKNVYSHLRRGPPAVAIQWCAIVKIRQNSTRWIVAKSRWQILYCKLCLNQLGKLHYGEICLQVTFFYVQLEKNRKYLFTGWYCGPDRTTTTQNKGIWFTQEMKTTDKMIFSISNWPIKLLDRLSDIRARAHSLQRFQLLPFPSIQSSPNIIARSLYLEISSVTSCFLLIT